VIRAMVRRAVLLAAVFAAVLTPVPCLGQTPKPLLAKATQQLPAEMLGLLAQKKMPKTSPIVLRIFKEESELEVWKQDTSGRFQILKTYPICRWSGDLGPKFYAGDRQAAARHGPLNPDPRVLTPIPKSGKICNP
jgi:murein L,D-transpeptidase YafK